MRLDGLRLAAFLRLGRSPVATRLALGFLGNCPVWPVAGACLWPAWNRDGDGRRRVRGLCLPCRLRHSLLQQQLRQRKELRSQQAQPRQPKSKSQQEAQCLKNYLQKTLGQCCVSVKLRLLQGRDGWATPTLLAAPERASAGLIATGHRDRAGRQPLRLRSAPALSRRRL